MTSELFDIFLSYTHHDMDSVAELHSALVANGMRVFRDENCIETFESISDRLASGLSSSKVLVAYYSRQYPTRRACQWELTSAFVAGSSVADPAERILVVNPESDVTHIVPTQLRDRLMSGPDSNLAAEAIAAKVRSIDGPLGVTTTSRPKYYGKSLFPSPRFTDRYETLWALHSALHAHEVPIFSDAYAPTPVVLWATGGMGKSLAVEEYATRFGGLYPGGIFWLRASGDRMNSLSQSIEQRSQQYLSIATRFLGAAAAGEGSPGEVVYSLFEAVGQVGPSLWVIDDLATGLPDEEFRAWLPAAKDAHCVITTRQRYPQGRSIALSMLSNQDAMDLLASHVSPSSDAEVSAAGELICALGGHAMAVFLASESLALEGGDTPFRSYTSRIAGSEYGIGVLDEIAHDLPNGHESSILATFGAAISRLSNDARLLLGSTALLAADSAIDMEVFLWAGVGIWSISRSDCTTWTSSVTEQIRHKVRLAIAELERHGLLKRLPDGSWQVHGLIAQVAGIDVGEPDLAAAQCGLAYGISSYVRTADNAHALALLEHARAVVNWSCSGESDLAANEAAMIALARSILVLADRVGAERPRVPARYRIRPRPISGSESIADSARRNAYYRRQRLRNERDRESATRELGGWRESIAAMGSIVDEIVSQFDSDKYIDEFGSAVLSLCRWSGDRERVEWWMARLGRQSGGVAPSMGVVLRLPLVAADGASAVGAVSVGEPVDGVVPLRFHQEELLRGEPLSVDPEVLRLIEKLARIAADSSTPLVNLLRVYLSDLVVEGGSFSHGLSTNTDGAVAQAPSDP